MWNSQRCIGRLRNKSKKPFHQPDGDTAPPYLPAKQYKNISLLPLRLFVYYLCFPLSRVTPATQISFMESKAGSSDALSEAQKEIYQFNDSPLALN
ncbi:hypothetical protein CDAR_576141 [Caerostris darwini]|uniref:Uncharacterized protein n=1 Tax=Caerostris darwini TaxID=1538125 RepID=A0AAV4TXS1_9ARAC|nr:hypothetical protein CDAR_576141 [Caerostris darwini]